MRPIEERLNAILVVSPWRASQVLGNALENAAEVLSGVVTLNVLGTDAAEETIEAIALLRALRLHHIDGVLAAFVEDPS